jgi:hypothetical protein
MWKWFCSPSVNAVIGQSENTMATILSGNRNNFYSPLIHGLGDFDWRFVLANIFHRKIRFRAMPHCAELFWALANYSDFSFETISEKLTSYIKSTLHCRECLKLRTYYEICLSTTRCKFWVKISRQLRATPQNAGIPDSLLRSISQNRDSHSPLCSRALSR